ncbi:MAG: hypothetical protein ACREOO_10390 [bacterium]
MQQRKTEDDKSLAIDLSTCAGRSVQKLPSMTEMISPEQQKRLLKKLFAGDKANFAHLLAQLDAISSWKEAHRFLDDYFQQHGINPYHDAAVCFSDLAYRRYFPQDTYLYSVHEDFAQTDLRFLPFLQLAQ